MNTSRFIRTHLRCEVVHQESCHYARTVRHSLSHSRLLSPGTHTIQDRRSRHSLFVFDDHRMALSHSTNQVCGSFSFFS